MLKIKFWRIENVIVMKILEQGDEIKRGCGEFFEHNGIILRSIDNPELLRDRLYVRGDATDNDNDCSVQVYDSAGEAKIHLLNYIAAIKAYNASLSGEEKETDVEEVIAE